MNYLEFSWYLVKENWWYVIKDEEYIKGCIWDKYIIFGKYVKLMGKIVVGCEEGYVVNLYS